MEIASILKLLREFPNSVLSDYMDKEGNYDIDALFSSYSYSDKIGILKRLGYDKYSIDDAVKDVKNRVIDYLIELNKVSKVLEDETEEKSAEQPLKCEYETPDYIQLIRIITAIMSFGKYDLNTITLFDAHYILIMQDPEYKTTGELMNEINKKINTKNSDTRLRRQQIWDSCSEKDKKSRRFMLHFLKSEDI